MNLNDSAFLYCIGTEITGLPIEIYLSTIGEDSDKVTPHIMIQDQFGFYVINIRNNYSSLNDSAQDIYKWVSENYDLLMKHWYHELKDEKITALLAERRK